MRITGVVVAALVLAGCATNYGEMGFMGGVEAVQISATTFRISARGNSYTDPTTISDYALRKSAETTLAHGYDWFVTVGSQDRSVSGQTVRSNPLDATHNPGQISVTNYVSPGQDVMIEVGRGPRPRGAMDAREILTYVVPRTGGPARSAQAPAMADAPRTAPSPQPTQPGQLAKQTPSPK